MDILKQIATDKQVEINELKASLPLSSFEIKLQAYPKSKFKSALSNDSSANIIAEIKKKSPSKGLLLENFNPKEIAIDYAKGGATCISVLTESKYFEGNYDYIAQVKEKVSLPVLCKDFIIDEYQLYHAKFIKADAILLIVSILSPEQITEYLVLARKLKLDAIVEVHNESETEIAVDCGADIIGVNNRNLADFSVSLEVSENLAELIPEETIKISESGIYSNDDIVRLNGFGYNCFLVGESLMKSDNRIEKLKSLKGK